MTAAMRVALAAGPLVRGRPRLPPSVENGLFGPIDWNLTILVALSFLVHFGVIGASFSDWADPVVPTDITAGGLIDLVRSLPPVDVEAGPDRDAPPTTSHTTQPSNPAPESTAARRSTGSGATPKGPASEARLRDLAAQAEAMHFELVGVAHSGTALGAVLSQDTRPPVDLDGAAASEVGASTARTGDLHIATGGGPVHPGARRDLSDVVGTHGRSDGTAGTEVRFTGPRADALLDPIRETVPVSHADTVIAALRPAFRRCYNQGLDGDPGMGGRVVLVANIGPNGEVSRTDVEAVAGLSEKVVQCLAHRVDGAQFESPGPNGSKLRIPITLLQQAR
jgi:hypothetical protein